MSKIIEVLVEVLIFSALIGVIANQIAGTATENLSAGAVVLYGIVTLFIVIGFVLSVAKFMGVKIGGR